MKKDFYSKLIQNLFFYFFVQGSTFFLNLFLIRTYNKDAYGTYAMILNTVILIGGIADFGMGSVASKFIAELNNNHKQRAKNILKLALYISVISSIIISLSFFLLHEHITKLLFGNSIFKDEVIISSLIILFFTLNTTLTGVLVGLGFFSQLAKISAIGGIAYLLLPLLLNSSLGIFGILLGVSLSYFLQVLLMYMLVFRTGLLKSGTGQGFQLYSEINLLYKYALPGTIGGVSAVFALWLLQYNLLQSYGGTKLIAEFNVAFSIKNIVLIVPAIVNTVSLNFLNGILGKEKKSYKNAFKLSNYTTIFSTIVLAIIFSFFSNYILQLFGKQYEGSKWSLFILLIATIPEAITISRSQILTSENKVWKSFFFINIPRDIFIIIILGSILISSYGIIGACMTYLFARIYSMISVYLMTFRSKLIV
jgi:O-antigen/teichoic acid export membrane protein